MRRKSGPRANPPAFVALAKTGNSNGPSLPDWQPSTKPKRVTMCFDDGVGPVVDAGSGRHGMRGRPEDCGGPLRLQTPHSERIWSIRASSIALYFPVATSSLVGSVHVRMPSAAPAGVTAVAPSRIKAVSSPEHYFAMRVFSRRSSDGKFPSSRAHPTAGEMPQREHDRQALHSARCCVHRGVAASAEPSQDSYRSFASP